MKRLLREPLLHFLLIGGALFALYASRVRGGETRERIVVSAGDVEHLAALFERTWMRPPSPMEVDGLIADHVRDEIAYREALARGLDRDDAIVRRRLRQKLEFVAEEVLAQAQPSEAELATYLAEHADKFALEPRTAFRHVFFSRERRGDAADADARALLARLNAGAGVDDGALGDATLLPSELELATTTEIERAFGAEFASAVAALPRGRWSEPIASTYGLHLVFVTAREEGRAPALDEVRDAVQREWFAARRTAGLDDFYRELAERYDVQIERAPKGGS